MASAELGNYHQRRFEGMINLPIVDDRLDIRMAGEWTKRQGYSFNELTSNRIDGRDLWSGRLTIGLKPIDHMQMYLIWERFQESDDRMRTSKQLCKNDPGLRSVGGVDLPQSGGISQPDEAFTITTAHLSQGCLPASLYAPESFEVPNGYSLPYVVAGYVSGAMNPSVDPYASTTQSTNLREIETQIDPVYKAKNDTVELNVDYNITPTLTFSSQTGYNQDALWSTEDYNRFNTSPGIFRPISQTNGIPRKETLITPDGYFCDPQLGCSNRLVAQDISREHAWQLSQEFRLASHLGGPFNFSAGGNYMHYETVEDYYVFANTLTLFAATSGIGDAPAWVPGVSDNHECLRADAGNINQGHGHQYNDPNLGANQPTSACYSIDPSSLASVDDEGHNYFLSRNPYTLNSYAVFGETYYNIFDDLKLTGGLRWTEDRKHFTDIPSELIAQGYGYASTGVVDQQWDKFTGRVAVNWTPKLDFTDQTLVYGSFARGYKAGGATPPGAVLFAYGPGVTGIPVHPLTFAPEYVNAFELGSKNTLLDGAITLNGNVFYYDYKGYQISEIVDRTSINLNFDATVKGAELEATYEPVPGLRFHFAGGYEHTRLADGSQSVDLIDRTAGHSGWVVMKPFVTQPSNCVFPDYVVAALVQGFSNTEGNPAVSACGTAYSDGVDPVAKHNLPVPGYLGFDPVDPNATNNGYGPAPNNGAGFSKDLSGNELPNAPQFTVSFSAEYTVPLTPDWAGTLRGDYYWQDYSWARVFNDNPYDRLRGYTNVNLALILTNQDGWQVMGYLKNVFDVTDITGTFLNSDDSGLTTNIFLTDPRLFGVRVTKNW
jgi:outer membrane receptor protein involved in Fe transport